MSVPHEPFLSVATPVYQAETCVAELYQRLVKVLEATGKAFEIIMIDDGSTDRSFEIISDICSRDSRVRGFRLSRNFGQHATLTACLDLALGEYLILMDCDLQDPPEEIPKFLAGAAEGFDIVLGRRVNRNDSLFKKLGSYLFYFIFNILTGTNFDRSISGYSLLSRKVVKSLRPLRENPRYFMALVHWVGFKVKKIAVNHAPNSDRQSTYTFGKLINFAFSVCIAYSDRPLKFSIKFGFAMSALSILVGITVYVLAMLGHIHVTGWASLMVSMYFLSGLIIANLGIVGLYIGRIMEQQKDRPIYILSEEAGATANLVQKVS